MHSRRRFTIAGNNPIHICGVGALVLLDLVRLRCLLTA